MTKKKWTSGDVVHALRVAYGVAGSALVTDEWSLLTEVPLRAPRAGYERYGEGFWSNTRTIDVLLTRNWTSGAGHRRIAVEVKVSRSDYRNETDLKRLPAERAAHHTYYAAPAGLIDPDTLPEGWGLIEVYEDRESYDAGKGRGLGEFQPGREAPLVKVRVRPVERTPECDLNYLVAAGMRRASRAEERIRRGEEDAAAVPALRAEVAKLTAQLERRDEAVRRERDKVHQLRHFVIAVEGGQDCADCENPVAYDTRRGVWAHRDRDHHKACEEARAEANRKAREAEFGARYLRGWPDPVEPKALRAQREGLPEEVFE